jgi:hypothetical protein
MESGSITTAGSSTPNFFVDPIVGDSHRRPRRRVHHVDRNATVDRRRFTIVQLLFRRLDPLARAVPPGRWPPKSAQRSQPRHPLADCGVPRPLPLSVAPTEAAPSRERPQKHYLIQAPPLASTDTGTVRGSSPHMSHDQAIFDYPLESRKLQSTSTLLAFYKHAKPIVDKSLEDASTFGALFQTIDQHFRPRIRPAIFDIIL